MISARIRHLLVERNWTKKQLAERAGIPVQTLYQFTTGNRVPRRANAEKVCKAFGMELEELFPQLYR